jgi:hypothetical protein
VGALAEIEKVNKKYLNTSKNVLNKRTKTFTYRLDKLVKYIPRASGNDFVCVMKPPYE